MGELDFTVLLTIVIANASPAVMAALGETLSEKAGVINLSLDGTILLSAMTGFAAAYNTGSVLLGFVCGALAGALVAAVLALFSIFWGHSQVAVGFVLTLMARELAYFLGNDYSRLHGPQAAPLPIPVLKDIPFIGPAFFSHSLPVYLSLLLIGLCWMYIYHTGPGLRLRSVGEHPAATYARGVDPRRIQTFYTILGGLLVGLAGATFSLLVKPGWGRPQGAEGTGWIALALVIFGGWHPVKAALGAYLFSFLQVMGIYLQGWLPSVPAQVFQAAPFPLMIFMLLIMNLAQREKVVLWAENRPTARSALRFFTGAAPAGLGKFYERE